MFKKKVKIQSRSILRLRNSGGKVERYKILEDTEKFYFKKSRAVNE